jgi:hypothetical protein
MSDSARLFWFHQWSLRYGSELPGASAGPLLSLKLAYLIYTILDWRMPVNSRCPTQTILFQFLNAILVLWGNIPQSLSSLGLSPPQGAGAQEKLPVLLQILVLAPMGFVQWNVSCVFCTGGSMNRIRQVSSLLLVIACSMQFSQAAFAQATVLTGQVASIGGAPPLLPRQAQVDDTPSYSGPTYVNPILHANANANGNAGLHANRNAGAGVNRFAGVSANRNAGVNAYRNASLNGNANANQNFHPQRPLIHTVYVQDNRTFFQRHPMVKSATIGAGVGAGAGALTGLVTGRGVIRGGLIGAGAGAGVGVVRSSQIMRRHPIVRDVATGSLVGLGLGAAASRGHRLPLQATAVGAALGLGVGLFKNLR